ncbi:arsenate reductase [Methylibium sp.]|jgi:Spx/MgsR family transcriptional regulator|uniref:arsenate reductase n=1 Tax=Methylibium sp. TaxID=2067992 RepID=UPI003D126859
MPTITLYGIPNCDTVKRARSWLAARDVGYTFHDLKKQGVPPDALAGWVAAVGWETLVNRKGTTWRQLDSAVRESVVDAASAQRALREHPSLVKRPVVEWPGGVSVGFDDAVFNARLSR